MNDTDPSDLQINIRLAGPDATAGLAIRLARHLRAGDVVLIDGPIGAGKSHFSRSLIQNRLAAEGRFEDVPSPTYTLVQVYALDGVEIWHADLYRLSAPEDVLELGLDDAFDQAICLVEWPDRLGDASPDGALTLRLVPQADDETREAIVSARAARWAPVLADLTAFGSGPA
jgi:tRNA threonylcarbamoyladenosine biosynthesis protein TsaE